MEKPRDVNINKSINNIENISILIVEDTEILRELMVKKIRRKYTNICITLASSYEEAKEKLLSNQKGENFFDLIILDWEPGEDKTGLDILKIIINKNKEEETKKSKIIFTSLRPDINTVRIKHSNDIDICINKDELLSNMVEVVEEVLLK